ncbi:hypothetical protein ACRRTK_012533 [Alexandromys fortis]
MLMIGGAGPQATPLRYGVTVLGGAAFSQATALEEPLVQFGKAGFSRPRLPAALLVVPLPGGVAFSQAIPSPHYWLPGVTAFPLWPRPHRRF